MERDWYRGVMLKLVDARETRPDEYISILDSELDEVIMRLETLRREGGMSNFGVKKGLNLLNDLRSRLENARNGQEVRAAFLELDEVKELVEEALETLAGRDERR
jgi:hypothetical protein